MWNPGQTVLDRYRLVALLGEGLGGETWEAEGPSGPVAVKLVKGEDARGLRDVFREAALLRELRHPHVVAYREFSDRPDEDCAILVTELVAGGDLEAWVALEGPRALSEVLRLGGQLLDALDALEAAGVLHRDLKPRNVLVAVDEAGRPTLRVADFGISRRTVQGVARTVDRALTPAYAAPEQFTGGALTRAADLYALGGLLGFMATGEHPAGGPVPTGHAGLDRLVGALRHPDPAQRPDLVATRVALEAIATDRAPAVEPVTATIVPDQGAWLATAAEPRGDGGVAELSAPPGGEAGEPQVPPSPRPDPRRRGTTVGLGLVAVVALVAVAGWLWRGAPAGDPAGPAAPSAPVKVSSPHPEAAAPPPAAAVEAATTPPAPAAAVEAPAAAVSSPAPAVPSPAAAASSPAPAVSSPAPAVSSPAAAVSSAASAVTVTLFVNSRPWSWVEVDGEAVGRTSDQGSRFTLPAGPHHLRLRAEDGTTWERDLDLGADRRICVNLRTGTELAC